jgi:hypothetical protein
VLINDKETCRRQSAELPLPAIALNVVRQSPFGCVGVFLALQWRLTGRRGSLLAVITLIEQELRRHNSVRWARQDLVMRGLLLKHSARRI